MESSASSSISLHEKLMDSTTFLVILGAILYTDTYLIIAFKENIFSVSLNWYQQNIQLKDVAIYTLSFSFLYGIIFPLIIHLLDHFLINSKMREKYENEVLVSSLKHDAIIENNPITFKIYENAKSKITHENHTRKVMLSIVLMIPTGLAFSMIFKDGEIDNISGHLITTLIEDNFISAISKTLVFFLAIWFLFSLKTPSSEYYSYEYIEGYHRRNESNWIRELDCGLIDKTDLFNSLACFSSRHEGIMKSIVFDPTNESHNYCQLHNLSKIENGLIKPTHKGLFFIKYLPKKISPKPETLINLDEGK